jgi:plasmid stabilization system protein ParE
MGVYEVRVSAPAENDLRDIARYITFQLSAPTTALNMIRTIREAIAKLEMAPLIHPLVRDDRLAAMGYRLLVVKNYIAFYIANEKEKTVDVDRILFGRRDWVSII